MNPVDFIFSTIFTTLIVISYAFAHLLTLCVIVGGVVGAVWLCVIGYRWCIKQLHKPRLYWRRAS